MSKNEELDEFEKDGLELGIETEPEEEEESKTKEETLEKEEGESESKEDEESEEEEKEEKEDNKSSKPKGSIYKEFNNLRSEHRKLETEKEAWQRERAELLEKSSKFDELERGKATEEQIKAAAIELAGEDATPEVLATTEKQVRALSKLFLKPQTAQNDEEIQKAKDKLAEIEDKETFRSEWKSFESDTLSKEFKGATRQQIEEAQLAMDELSHAPQFADKEFDYVYFKNRDIFQEILKPKVQKSFESRDIYREDGEEKTDLEDKYKGKSAKDIPIKDLLKMDKDMENEAEAQDDGRDWNIKKRQSF